MKIALASPPFPDSLADGLCKVEEFMGDAAEMGAEIICFPESYLPGMRGMEFEVGPHNPDALVAALEKVKQFAGLYATAVIIPMDWAHPDGGIVNLAFLINASGELLGHQTKNELDASEDDLFIPGDERKIFEVNGLKFGITICHEGFRCPESVRWAAIRDAKIVFHPHCTGANSSGVMLKEWGHKDNPFFEKAMICRAMENNIYFASVNYALKYQKSVTALIDPEGRLVAHEQYGRSGLLLAEIEPERATGEMARRFRSRLKSGLV